MWRTMMHVFVGLRLRLVARRAVLLIASRGSQMVNSLNRIGLSPNCSVENRKLAVDLAQLIISWVRLPLSRAVPLVSLLNSLSMSSHAHAAALTAESSLASIRDVRPRTTWALPSAATHRPF